MTSDTEVAIGAPNSPGRQADYWARSEPINGLTFPQFRLSADGKRWGRATYLQAWVSGRYAARTGTLEITQDTQPTIHSDVPYPLNSKAVSTGFRAVRKEDKALLVGGGKFTFWVRSSFDIWFATGGAGNALRDDGYASFGEALACGYRYEQVPTAPSISSSVVGGSGDVTLNISAPSNDGGSPVSGYRIQWAQDAGFTTSVGSADIGKVVSWSGSGFAPNTIYFFRVAAKNGVTAAAGTVSEWSAPVSAFVHSAGKVLVDGAWTDMSARVKAGGVWRSAIPHVFQNGSWTIVK